MENFITRSMLVNLIWSFSGDGNWKSRKTLSDFVRHSTAIQLPPDESVHWRINFKTKIFSYL